MDAKSSLAAVSFMLLFGSANCLADDVAESFSRMLTHQPGHGTLMTDTPSEADPPVAAIVVPLRDGVWPADAAADPVTQTFKRMLAHTPNSAAPSVPVGLGADPLLEALVEPVRRWLSEDAATTRYANAVAPRPQR